MKGLKWVDKNLEEIIMAVCLTLMTMLMGIQICSRYLFNNSLSWTEEVTRYLFVWSGFTSISFCMTKGIAIRLEQLSGLLPPKLRAASNVAVHLVELCFFAVMLPFAWKYLQSSVRSGQLSTACRLPMYLVQSAPFICFLLACFRTIQRIVLEIKGIRGNEV